MEVGALNNELGSLDKDTPVPLYYQLQKKLKELVSTGALKPGDQIPSERELSEQFGISRPTVRQAINELVYQGLMYREKGKGTFVARPKIPYNFANRLVTFYDDMEQKGYRVRTQVISKDVRPVRGLPARFLDIEEGTDVIVMERVRFVEDEPALRVTNYIPHSIAPGLLEEDLSNCSLYSVLTTKYSIKPLYSDIILEATIADWQDSQFLRVPVGSPVFIMDDTTYDENDNAIDYSVSRFRGDLGRIRIRVNNE